MSNIDYSDELPSEFKDFLIEIGADKKKSRIQFSGSNTKALVHEAIWDMENVISNSNETSPTKDPIEILKKEIRRKIALSQLQKGFTLSLRHFQDQESQTDFTPPPEFSAIAEQGKIILQKKLNLTPGKLYDFEKFIKITEDFEQEYPEQNKSLKPSEVLKLLPLKYEIREFYYTESIIDFLLMTPAQREEWINNFHPIDEDFEKDLVQKLELPKSTKFSLSDILRAAADYDQNISGEFGQSHSPSIGNIPKKLFTNKKYSLQELLKYVLKSHETRYTWLEIQFEIFKNRNRIKQSLQQITKNFGGFLKTLFGKDKK